MSEIMKRCTNSNGCGCAMLARGDLEKLKAAQDACVMFKPLFTPALPCEKIEYKLREAEQTRERYRIIRRVIGGIYWTLTAGIIAFVIIKAIELGGMQ